MPGLMKFAILFVGTSSACISAGCDRQASPHPVSPSAQSTVAGPNPTNSVADSPAPRGVRSQLSLPAKFVALGTEPFWAAEVDGQTMRYSTPENQAGQHIAVVRTARGSTIVLRGILAGQDVVLSVAAGPCSDGMSDIVYEWTVIRQVGDHRQNGCARPSTGQANAALRRE